jgi:hypothetical protein
MRIIACLLIAFVAGCSQPQPFGLGNEKAKEKDPVIKDVEDIGDDWFYGTIDGKRFLFRTNYTTHGHRVLTFSRVDN